ISFVIAIWRTREAESAHMKSTTLQLINSVTRSLIRHGLFLTVLVLACFALSPQVRADCQEGCLTNENTVLGDDALVNNTAEGNIAVGAFAGANIKGSNNLDIGNRGKTNDSNTIRIGTTSLQNSTFIAGISGVTVSDGVGVIVDTHGHLGTVVSSKRYKDDIKSMN